MSLQQFKYLQLKCWLRFYIVWLFGLLECIMLLINLVIFFLRISTQFVASVILLLELEENAKPGSWLLIFI